MIPPRFFCADAGTKVPAILSERFLLSCQKETPQTPKRKPLGARRSQKPVFAKLSVIERFPSRRVNDCPHRRPCVCFASLAATLRVEAERRFAARPHLFPASAATNGSNARFWRHPSFTTRDDRVESTSRRFAARYASKRSLAFFFGAPLPFLWARPKKWGGKGFYKGLPLFCPAARSAAL